jgi:hypothetical protein
MRDGWQMWGHFRRNHLIDCQRVIVRERQITSPRMKDIAQSGSDTRILETARNVVAN